VVGLASNAGNILSKAQMLLQKMYVNLVLSYYVLAEFKAAFSGQ